MGTCHALLGIVVLLSSDTVANIRKQYLCITDMATGFSYDKQSKKWVTSNFESGSKYVISRRDEKPGASFEVTKFGQKFPEMNCEENQEHLFCGYEVYQLRFNRDNGRFMLSFFSGYVPVPNLAFPNDERSDRPYIAIGKCSPF